MASGLTQSERAILEAIWNAPDKVLDWSSCWHAAGLTVRGGRTVLNRMLDRRLIAPSEIPATYRWPTITFAGMQAIGVTRTAEVA